MNSALEPENGKVKMMRPVTPVVMGILNLTPDSFFDGGKYKTTTEVLATAEKMIADGAGILDIGAMSTRPFAQPVSETVEWERIEKVLPLLRKSFPEVKISLDTYRSEIAARAMDEGADMINDISGGQFDAEMFPLVAARKIPYILMHIKGNPQTMQENPQYDDVVVEVAGFFREQLQKLEKLGKTEDIILDPGFGFGKTVEHNFSLLAHLKTFPDLGFPVLAGLSRKSMVNKVLGTNPENALNGTTALNMVALLNGAAILRVHDVKEAVEVVKLFTTYQKSITG